MEASYSETGSLGAASSGCTLHMEFRPPLFPRTTIIKQQPSGHTASSDLLYFCQPFLRTRERRANRTAPIPGRLGLDSDASHPTESQDVSIPVSGSMTLQTLRVKLVGADFFIVSGYGITTRSPWAHMICPVQRVSSSPLLQPLQYSRYTRYMIATHVSHMLVIGRPVTSLKFRPGGLHIGTRK